MKKRNLLLGIAVLGTAMSGAAVLAQEAAAPLAPADPSSAPPPPAAGPDISSEILEWVPPALSELSSQAVAKESFTLDRTMLAAAAGLMGDSDPDAKQAVAKLDGLSVHMLRFAEPGMADPAQIEAIRAGYHLRGWKHVVSTSRSAGPVHDGSTDVWLVMDGANVRGGVVLLESPKSLTLVTVAGNLSPVDILHLRGHFGIPRLKDDSLGPARN